MKFGPVPLAEAEGGILAHSLALPAGRLRKGRRLDAGDLAQLKAAGVAEVTIARLEPGDIHEDEAATAIAAALLAPGRSAGLGAGPASAGRVNIVAQTPGLAALDVAALHGLNAVDPAITVATVPPWHRLAPGDLLATVKIIPYAVAGAALAAASARGAGALALQQPVLRSACLIETCIAGQARGKGRAAIAARLEALGVVLGPDVVQPHEPTALAAALSDSTADLVLILTGSATSDAADTAPDALHRAGGHLAHFGMPVDPGNLLFIGALPDGRPVIGLPGCARSPALNGADWVLERVICGLPIGTDDITRMGVGGLLKEIPTRPRPRQRGTI